MKTYLPKILVLGCLMAGSPALAEVSDKIPTVGTLWSWAIGCNILALIIGLWRPWAALAVWPFAAFLAYGQYELVSTDLATAILREQGQSYGNAAYGSAALLLIGPLMTCLLLSWLKSARRRSNG